MIVCENHAPSGSKCEFDKDNNEVPCPYCTIERLTAEVALLKKEKLEKVRRDRDHYINALKILAEDRKQCCQDLPADEHSPECDAVMTPEQKMQKIVEAAGECWHVKKANSIVNQCNRCLAIADNPSPTDLNELHRLAEKLGWTDVVTGVEEDDAYFADIINSGAKVTHGNSRSDALLNVLYESLKEKETNVASCNCRRIVPTFYEKPCCQDLPADEHSSECDADERWDAEYTARREAEDD